MAGFSWLASSEPVVGKSLNPNEAEPLPGSVSFCISGASFFRYDERGLRALFLIQNPVVPKVNEVNADALY